MPRRRRYHNPITQRGAILLLLGIAALAIAWSCVTGVYQFAQRKWITARG